MAFWDSTIANDKDTDFQLEIINPIRDCTTRANRLISLSH